MKTSGTIWYHEKFILSLQIDFNVQLKNSKYKTSEQGNSYLAENFSSTREKLLSCPSNNANHSLQNRYYLSLITGVKKTHTPSQPQHVCSPLKKKTQNGSTLHWIQC